MDIVQCSICGEEYERSEGHACRPEIIQQILNEARDGQEVIEREGIDEDLTPVIDEMLAQPITLAEAARWYPLAYSTLAQAAREGRFAARQSGATWITTRGAIEAAIKAGTLRPRR